MEYLGSESERADVEAIPKVGGPADNFTTAVPPC